MSWGYIVSIWQFFENLFWPTFCYYGNFSFLQMAKYIKSILSSGHIERAREITVAGQKVG